MKINNKQPGYTLIELTLALLILGTVLFLSVPKFFIMIIQAKQATTKGYLATLRSVTNLYYSDNNFFPYAKSILPLTDENGVKYDTIKTAEQKKDNPWVPKYISKWPQAIRTGHIWGSDLTGKNHEGGNDMRITDRALNPKTNNDWPEEIIYNRSQGKVYINSTLIGEDGKYIHEW